MLILAIGVVFALILLFVPRILGRSMGPMLEQYEILERRFHLKRKTYTSAWGQGIGERVSLPGEFRGYPLTLYDHSNESDAKKRIWTTLAFEMLYADELELVLNPSFTESDSRYSTDDSLAKIDSSSRLYDLFSNDEERAKRFLNGPVIERLSAFPGEGAFRLSKGFFEYRELGRMKDASMRNRYQDAMLLLAEMGDRIEELVR